MLWQKLSFYENIQILFKTVCLTQKHQLVFSSYYTLWMNLVDLFCIDERNCTSLQVTENKSGFILFSVKNKNRNKKIRNINKSLENVTRHNQNNKTLCAFENGHKYGYKNYISGSISRALN